MADVEVAEVRKVYPDGFKAVHGVSFKVPDRSFTILVGPSGCGKSTILRMIAGLEDVTEGEIKIGGEVVNDRLPKDRDIAMVFQSYALYPHKTVFENMAFGLRLRGAPADEVKRRVEEAAEILSLTTHLHRKPHALSGGQRQRVALGRAIVRKPKVFLFDEPLSNLDAHLRVQMRNELARLHTRLQATMIFVTHDQVEAMTLGDRIVVLKDGLIQQAGPPLEVFRSPANRFVAGFIGSPPMNFLDLRPAVRDGETFLESDAVSLRATPEMARALDGKRRDAVLLGIRPENIQDRLFAPEASADRTVSATVEVVEPMGTETYVHTSVGRAGLSARFEADHVPDVQQQISLVLDLSRAFLFDREDGARIC